MDSPRGRSAAGRPTGDHPMDHQRHPRRCQVSTQRVKAVEAELLVFLMRFLSLRLYPKAAAAPKRGRGPGTDDDGVGGWTIANTTGATGMGIPSVSQTGYVIQNNWIPVVYKKPGALSSHPCILVTGSQKSKLMSSVLESVPVSQFKEASHLPRQSADTRKKLLPLRSTVKFPTSGHWEAYSYQR